MSTYIIQSVCEATPRESRDPMNFTAHFGYSSSPSDEFSSLAVVGHDIGE